MSRLLKKCFFLSVGLHVLLVAVLILGAAFLVTQPEKLPPVLSMIDPNVLDDLLSPSTPDFITKINLPLGSDLGDMPTGLGLKNRADFVNHQALHHLPPRTWQLPRVNPAEAPPQRPGIDIL